MPSLRAANRRPEARRHHLEDLVAKAVIDPKAEKKSYDFAKIEALDSDGDGVKNIDEIKAGTNPGDAKSK